MNVYLNQNKFGTETTFRGGSWRGRDCNGIVGMNPSTGQTYEYGLCNDTKRLDIAVLGDSILAHFHMPEQWLDAREFSEVVFEHLPFILQDELDWPDLSAITGHINVSWPNIEGQ
jgi:acyloxyacyl hydrolase